MASAAMWVNAALMFRSPFRPDMNSQAVTPFTTTPASETMTITSPPVGAGSIRRWIASQAMPPVTTSSTIAFASAARIEERRRPYV